MGSNRKRLTRAEWVVLAVLYGIPLLGNIHVVSTVFGLLWKVPAGTPVRPMGMACWIILVAILTAVIGSGVSLVVLVRRRRTPLFVVSALFCLALSWMPFFAGRWTFQFIVKQHGLIPD